MDLNNVAPDRREVLEKIALYERQRRFDEDVENDPPAPVLLPDRVDYLNKKLKSRIATGISNFIADHAADQKGRTHNRRSGRQGKSRGAERRRDDYLQPFFAVRQLRRL